MTDTPKTGARLEQVPFFSDLGEDALGEIAAADSADLATLRRSFRIPQRLLLIGLPLTIAFGFGVGRLLFPAPCF